MSERSGIAWTNHTFNPWIGCARVSEGCRNCYAETLALQRGWARWGVDADRYITKSASWRGPRKWNKAALKAGDRRRVFCASLADVFDSHPGIVEARARLWQLIAETPNLDWLLLTKRPENIKAMLPGDWGSGYANVWLGTTVEDSRVAHRIDTLREVPAAVRFISYEPAIGPMGDVNLNGIHWVICGGESGANYREMKDEWARDMRDLCHASGVAFFFKQHNGLRSGVDPTLDGITYHEFPKSNELRAIA